MKKRGLGWPFWVGVAYLVVLALFAAFGPGMRHPHDSSATQGYGVGLRFDQAREGAKVGSVQPGTPADDAGIAVGDGLTHVDGEPLGG
ncbi:MAG: PDZ domain-containing protein, partial [Gemmatimonadetes bacterium]|nr:PDZ domain-containing protein [Gemmatimonadota bacterium]